MNEKCPVFHFDLIRILDHCDSRETIQEQVEYLRYVKKSAKELCEYEGEFGEKANIVNNYIEQEFENIKKHFIDNDRDLSYEGYKSVISFIIFNVPFDLHYPFNMMTGLEHIFKEYFDFDRIEGNFLSILEYLKTCRNEYNEIIENSTNMESLDEGIPYIKKQLLEYEKKSSDSGILGRHLNLISRWILNALYNHLEEKLQIQQQQNELIGEELKKGEKTIKSIPIEKHTSEKEIESDIEEEEIEYEFINEYQSVIINDDEENYYFTPNQAEIVKYLYEVYLESDRYVHMTELVDIFPQKDFIVMYDIFKGKNIAFYKKYIEKDNRGGYRLRQYKEA